jgi:hypothetical protein
MTLLVTFGVMNMAAMVPLAAIVLVEKVSRSGPWFSAAIDVVASGLAVVVAFDPALGAGLQSTPAWSCRTREPATAQSRGWATSARRRRTNLR